MFRRNKGQYWLGTVVAGALLVPGAFPVFAASICVNPSGTGGCYKSISAAVTAAGPGATIMVSQGTYSEDVTISKPLSLIGANRQNTIIDATNLLNGVTINGTADVAVSGFTVENAETAGIWITNSSRITISDNIVRHNDLALSSGQCPPLAGTPFENGESFDCGEGIFLSAVDHSILTKNLVTENAGGILITDDTGPTHNNLVAENSVIKNTELDCGITLPSHSGAGVFDNTISGNDSSYNGGPGVGIFAPGPGSKAYGNVVIHNRLRGNGLPGVTMHNHAAPGIGGVPPQAPPVMFDNNLIVGNEISANSQDFEDAATSGPTGINVFSVAPMMGTVIAENFITQEILDVVVNVPPTGTTPAVQVHFNNFPAPATGLQDVTGVVVNATQNWWGCSGGPTASGCATVSGTGIQPTPWLRQPFAGQ